MPIIGNFPKRQTYSSEITRGLTTKEDVAFLHSLQDKLDSVGDIIGRKVHSFASITELKTATNLADGDIVLVLGNKSILDDGYIRLYKILVGENISWPSNKGYIYIIGSPASAPPDPDSPNTTVPDKVIAGLITKIMDNDTVNAQLAAALADFTYNVEISQSEIEDLVASAGTEDCEEITNSRIDENGIIFSSMKQRIDNIAILCNNRDIRKYGVKFIGSRYAGTRLYNAYGKKTKASTDTYKGSNDFDSIYPWSHMIRCNGYYNEDGNFIVTAYEGEPGFALDGSNGNVWVEVPVFYIKEDIDANGDLVMELCSAELGEYRLPEKFINSDGTTKEKVYISAYNVASYNNNPASVSGLYLDTGSYDIFLNEIKTLGNNYCGYSTEDYEIIRFLFCIEYATRNTQGIMYGATKLTQSAELAAVENTNTLTIPTTSVKFVVNQICCIYNTDGNIVNDNLTILSVNVKDGSTYITVDGDPITIKEGYTIYSKPWKTGSTDSVLGPSGSPVSNISGYYPCRYRFIENPWGNQWSVLYQTLCKANKVYFCKSAANLSNKTSNKYKVLTYTCPEVNGYIMNLGFDDRFPSCRFTSDVEGGNSYTAYSDLYIANNLEVAAVLMGGSITSGVAGGLHCMSTELTSLESMYYGTRLSYSK